MKKLFTTFFLVLVASIGTMFAESGTCGDNLTWDLTDGVLTISGTGEMEDYSYFSNSYAPAPWYSYCKSIKIANIENGVTSIGSSAFSNCSGLTSIEIPNSVTSIENWAFEGCTGLTSVTIPNSVISIGYSAFSGCSGLTSIEIPNSVTSIGDYAFSLCIGLTSVTIPNSVTSIGNGAFSGCSSLTSINVALDNANYCSLNGVLFNKTQTTLIQYPCCQQGTYIIPNSVISIGNSAFSGCSGLTSVTIPNSVTSIGSEAFRGCSGLTSVSIPNSVTSIGSSAFSNCSGLTSIEIPNSVTSIENWAFEGCTGLTSVTIPNSVISIGYSAFSGCSGLTSIEIPNSVTSIGDYAFSYCSSLTSVTIPNSVTSIGSSAFSNCSGLTSIEIPNSVTSIGDYAFYNCNSLTSVHIADIAKWCTINFGTENANPLYYAHNLYLNGIWVTDLVIPNSVTNIKSNAFHYCRSLTSVTIPNSVTSIGNSAFENCSGLTSVTIPNSVTSIGSEAFRGCSGLTSVSIPNSVTSIGDGAFAECGNLASAVLSDSIKTIPQGMFFKCKNLTSVTIGRNVSKIRNNAFSQCSGLKSIHIHAVTPPAVESAFVNASNNINLYVPFGCVETYKAASGWKSMNVFSSTLQETSVSSTAFIDRFTSDVDIVSCGISGSEQQPGNVLEYTGLEPNSEYKDIPVVLTSNTGETETVNVSFSTTALELTTKASKPVSSTTAILLAETNMSDAEVSCGFEWKRENAPDAMEGTKVYCPVASGQMAGRLKGLKDDVYYKYRAFYQSAAGNMYYGDWQYIFTGDATVEFDPILYTYGASVVTENEATVSGYALAGSEDLTEQGIEYWAESRVEEQSAQVPSPRRMVAGLNEHFFVPASGIKMTATLTDLDEGTVYKYRVYGKVGDQYYYGTEQTFTTKGVYEEESPTSIEEVPSDPQSGIKAQKILRNGQIFILRGDKVYTITGQEVK